MSNIVEEFTRAITGNSFKRICKVVEELYRVGVHNVEGLPDDPLWELENAAKKLLVRTISPHKAEEKYKHLLRVSHTPPNNVITPSLTLANKLLLWKLRSYLSVLRDSGNARLIEAALTNLLNANTRNTTNTREDTDEDSVH
jgi:hypothetical protein